jgi:hypothetical protein
MPHLCVDFLQFRVGIEKQAKFHESLGGRQVGLIFGQ